MAYQDVLDGVARVVGGTVTSKAGLYSGAQAGDHTGLSDSGLKGCWSRQPETVTELPMGVVLAHTARQRAQTQGNLDQTDNLTLLILLSRNDSYSQTPTAVNFRDALDAAFLGHMQLFGTAAVVQAFPIDYTYGLITYMGNSYVGWHVTIEVMRKQSPTYTP